MTLILSVATPACALHVGDRLVSKDEEPHDPLANKSVVFRATDGLLAFGYTGLAFLEDVPTDTWIADVLSGGCCVGDVGAVRHAEFPVRDAKEGAFGSAPPRRDPGPTRCAARRSSRDHHGSSSTTGGLACEISARPLRGPSRRP
jgi:hypothetical protein